ncbi:hypothetical protein [Vibrio scophthalmi]|uniref:Uncharacterized protein n=1 Tax=Vibrio scophthalmi LMG 19158 TaxID=870967 RepID=F9RP59_9VIBR|nr:hypothetical protein [Vibrio scophthalmi]EGU35910.1 hypothetical protein VIS19158_13992 [Vibrio scophthalmi LMG 19158]
MKGFSLHCNEGFLIKVLVSLGAGYLGGVANVITIWFINIVAGKLILDSQFLYKQIAWGGLWAVFYVVDVFGNNWKVKGFAISILATVFTFFVFRTLDVTFEILLRSFVVNVIIWGGVSSFLYHKTLFNSSEGE